MQHIGTHMQQPSARSKKDKVTERGELMQYFLEKLNKARVRDGLAPMTMGRMARLCMAMKTHDLYYLQSICDKASDFSKKFWWEINPKNHTPEKIQERERAQQQFFKTFTRVKNTHAE